MQIHLICMGSRMPTWVNQGVQEYLKRMPPACRVRLTEIPLQKRPKSAPLTPIINLESEKLLAASAPKHHRIALDQRGQSWSTEQLSEHLQSWMLQGDDIDLFIGGPDGFSLLFLQQIQQRWSLSQLTLPHMLVRVIVAEQLYRACMLLTQHPYHRP